MSQYRLLVVEDDPRIAKLITEVAGEVGFDAYSAAGATAMATYDSIEPHVLVLDILMPEVDGLEVLQALKIRGSETRIIILSGGQDSYRRIAENLGIASGLVIEANLPKPFRISEIRTLLEQIKASIKAPKKENG